MSRRLFFTGNTGFRSLVLAFCLSSLTLYYVFFFDSSTALQAATFPPTPRVLLVSAFFPLSKSKHPMSDYEAWFRRFLQPITSDLYFFCPPDVAPLIRALRGDLPLTLNTSFTSPFDIPPLKGLDAQYVAMHEQDPEKAYHSPELYAVWNGKPYFLVEGVKNAESLGKTYDYAFWSDAGSMRDNNRYRDWPGGRRVGQVFAEGARLTGSEKEDLIFFPIWNGPPERFSGWKEDMGPIDETVSEGSFFGGALKAITRYHDLYYEYHDRYLAQGIFVGKDQTLINALFYLFPSHFFSVHLYDGKAPASEGVPKDASTPIGECGSTWWYYQWWVADAHERDTTAQLWLEEGQGREKSVQWREDARCRLTRTLGMEWLLRSVYGNDWTLPKASVQW
ncbi:hypothetical protein BV25DRAFT_1812562 [Artomyces pyxidatus]|uniref:Uncharacterized protein n=1 Tax=Artomyces pyxidatus TaxID=48021 RepID=A0ACB8SNE1_9AGAM|nr:hypothetical protein BV25DRAFT_1812562 [Artomyces pyxidatus]